MGVQNLVAQLFIDGVWTTCPAFTTEEVETSIGPQAESGTEPNKIDLTWDNTDLSMDPYNAESPLNGKIGRNTAARVRVDGTTITQAQASVWSPDATADFVAGSGRGRSWTTFRAEGLLRQLGKWEDPLDSAMTRNMSRLPSLIGLWPLENGNSDTRRLSELSGAEGAAAGYYSGNVTMGGDDGAPGSDPTIVMGTDGAFGGRFRRHLHSGFQVVFHARMNAVPGGAGYNTIFLVRLSNANTIEWRINNTNYQIVTLAPDGTALGTITVGRGSIDVTRWVRHRIKVSVSGGTVNVEPAWYDEEAAFITGTNGTYSASSTGAPLSWQVTYNSYTADAAYSHVFGVTDTSLDLIGNFAFWASFKGYRGEPAGTRFARLMAEEGLTAYISGASDSVAMGRQRSLAFLDLLEECMVTDRGLLYDEPLDARGLTFRTSADIREQDTPKLELTFGVDIAPPLKPLTDDEGVVNHVTVKNSDDATAVSIEVSGPLSVLPPTQGGIGPYKKQVDVNQDNTDDALTNRANWERVRGTIDRPRYRVVTIDLVANPEHAAAVTALRPGDLITIAGREPETIRLHVLNIAQKIGAATRKAVLSCLSADAWAYGVYDTARYDSGSVILLGAISAGATSFRVTSALSEPVSTTATDFDVICGGTERMTMDVSGVSAVTTDATLVAGTFESGVADWQGFSGAIAQSNTFAQAGTWSARLTVSGSPTQAYIRPLLANCPQVIPGNRYSLSAYVRVPVNAADVRATIDWLDADGNWFASSDSGAAALTAAAGWVQRNVTLAEAPEGAYYAMYGTTILSSPSNGTLLYTDTVTFTSPERAFQTVTVVRSVNGVTKAHPARAQIVLADSARYA